ncbi:RNA polymerase sigma factor RpoH [Trichlorobacter lovleyi]|uniref:RNA polymerase sigma factor n=1 Tax=Trichlorobacter lovleyi (strain ATCC BAA-1151 / DSM 17278 / SZ) TaxID=398767 RepID=B3E7R9_TRIL1|nr:RNA polymerase sigma factor RpoH [Trichlorobacter lovleyi]ACD95051.1 RNA polymerase, sigma 32 subunit, RpoH [Trichlorobacter lovleyi SZ]
MYAAIPVTTDSFSKYLSEIKSFPLLDEQEEHRLAVRLFEENDLSAAQTLITSNLRFVVKIAAEYRNYGLKMLDLIQEGNIGLMLAVRKFNPYRGFRLITYAVWWIRAQIQSYIVSSWSLLKIGTTQAQRKLFFKLKQAKNAILSMNGGDEGDLPATALSLDVREAEVEEMELRLMGEVSLDAEQVAGEGGSLLETLVDDRPNQESQLADLQEQQALRVVVADAVSRLGEKEQFVVKQRIVADDPMTLQEIADHFSISRERVRQIEENALRKIKGFLGASMQLQHV